MIFLFYLRYTYINTPQSKYIKEKEKITEKIRTEDGSADATL